VNAPSPWPHPVRLAEAARHSRREPLRRRLEAGEAERRAIAEALDLERLDSLTADLDLYGWFDGVAVEGRFEAAIVQICGVSLEPFESRITGAFCVHAVPEGSPHAPSPDDEVVVDLDAEDPPDVLEGDAIDLGAYVVEHLALEIDPFPRKPGAEFVPPEPEPESSPFAVLKGLKDRGPTE
jgi:uncharacterized metal-binding protein YceD (DUF177 family)